MITLHTHRKFTQEFSLVKGTILYGTGSLIYPVHNNYSRLNGVASVTPLPFIK